MQEQENDYVYLLTEGTLHNGTNYGIVKYVGVTGNPEKRRKEHKREKPPHEFYIITTLQDGTLAGHIEQSYIDFFDTNKGSGWNKSKGGEKRLSGVMHPRYGTKHTEEVKKKISIGLTGKVNTQNQKDIVADANSMKWIVETPEGNKERVYNLNEFARKHNLGTAWQGNAIRNGYSLGYRVQREFPLGPRGNNRNYRLSKKYPILDIFSGAIL
jgi:hypothetical protein